MLDNNTRYVYEVYRQKSVSGAANALFVSQPAISAAIRKVEKELGAPIFNRKTLPFTLTDEGKIYMESAEKMLNLETQTAERIYNVRQSTSGTLRIAVGYILSARIVPKILRGFCKQFPQVDVRIFPTEPEELFECLEKGLADVILQPPFGRSDGFISTTLFSQRGVVVMSEDSPVDSVLRQHSVSRTAVLTRDYPVGKTVTDLSLFQDVKFIPVPPGSFINRLRAALFGKFNTSQKVFAVNNQMTINYNLMLAGFGALLTTDAYLAALPQDTGCMHFVLGLPESVRPFTMVYRQKSEEMENTILAGFVEAAKDFFANENPLQKILEG